MDVKKFIQIIRDPSQHIQENKDQNTCSMCDGPALEFKDELSKKEYKISAMCQKCQDEFFTEPEE